MKGKHLEIVKDNNQTLVRCGYLIFKGAEVLEIKKQGSK